MKQALTVQPRLKAANIQKSPWYDILLFRTRLRVKIPKATARIARDALGNIIDRRPFLNTVAKTEYDCNDRLGRCVIDIYHSAWRLYPKHMLSRSHASLSLFLRGLGVTRAERRVYRDLYQLDTASIWIRNYYSGATHQFDELPGATPVGGKDQHNGVESDGKPRFSVEEISINGVKLFFCRPFKNQLDYFLPFSAADLLQFSFQITPKNARAEKQFAELIQTTQQFALSMLDTLALAHEEPPLRR